MASDLTVSLWQRLSRLFPYFNRPRKYWVTAIFFTLLMSATEPMLPALLQPLLDSGFKQNSFPIWLVPTLIIGLFALKGVANFCALMSLAKIANLGVLRIRTALFQKLLQADLKLFRKESASSLSNTVVHEVQNGSMQLVHSSLTVARDSLTLVGLIGYLLYLNWQLTLVVAFMLPAVALIMKLLTKRLYRIAQEGQVATEEMAYAIEENVLAHRDIRLYAAQEGQLQRFLKMGHTLNRVFTRTTAASAAMTPLTQVMASISLAVVVTIALHQSATQTTTVGQFAAFVMAMLMLLAPIKHLSEVTGQITRGLVAIERGVNLIEITPEEFDGTYTQARCRGELKFKGVSVRFDDSSAWALTNIDLELRPSETVALVGASGAGKTTLANLIPRFVQPSAGLITLDGIPLEAWSLKNLRSQIAIVSQHVLLLNDTVTANVALGALPDKERVIRALTAANLLDVVEALPQGLDTVLGHNAMQLSGGQRQRLAIARAIYKDAPILILDEATSALDNESERTVQEALQTLMKFRTTLVVAHRLSTVQHADRIVVMESGQIIETGVHNDLLALNRLYAKLYRLGLQ